MSSEVPDTIGLWTLVSHDGDVLTFETYELPTGHLVAWCEEVGLVGGVLESLFWCDDEWVGHIPVELMVGWGTFNQVAETGHGKEENSIDSSAG